MRVAALDFGTNTFLLLIAEVESGEIKKVLHDEAVVVRLGQNVHETKRFHKDALARADECLDRFASTIQRFAPEKVLACATSAARDVTNSDELFKIASRYAIPLEIISGDREAELTFSGTINKAAQGSVALIDVGGGSTEFIVGSGVPGLKTRKSIDIGAVRLTELFVTKHPVDSSELAKMTQYIQNKILEVQNIFQTARFDRVIAVAGTPTTLAAIDQGLPFESNRVDGYVLSIEKLAQWIDQLAAMNLNDRMELAGMEPKRADVIVAGAMVLLAGAVALGAKELIVSVRGLRYGIARHLGGS
jgi:exopolyphosphatase/guanosine-5'-triphosphate,3'-diphosphate pyrophosphatase